MARRTENELQMPIRKVRHSMADPMDTPQTDGALRYWKGTKEYNPEFMAPSRYKIGPKTIKPTPTEKRNAPKSYRRTL